MRELVELGPGQRVPVRSWARKVSRETERQWLAIASTPYVVEAVAAMADAHVSDGVAVGTVFATESEIVPGALGCDLGCGVTGARLSLAEGALGDLASLVEKLDRAIPTGDAVHRGAGVAVPLWLFDAPLSTATLERTRDALARKHLGTLGGGNHFVEIDRDPEGGLWLLIHSGSRGLGAAIATHHVAAARASPGASALSALDTRDARGAACLADVAWALAFASANRAALLERAVAVVADAIGGCEVDRRIDVHHNFVAREVWSGRDVLVHRKGAISAPDGVEAIVPGSMATASYVVRGRGNGASFGSCSHGAGRVLTRKEARARVSMAGFERSMRSVAYPRERGRALVEEAPAAYRDIVEVLRDQADLVDRVVRLEPLLVLKG